MNQRADGKSAPEIVKARALVRLRSAQTGLLRQVVEGSAHRGTHQAAAMIVEKETGRRCVAKEPVAAFSLVGYDIPSGSVERNQPGFSKLRLADGEDSLAKIHMRPLQFEGLTDT